jgi:hypothetical protein
MNFRVQFLDASANVIAEWSADAHSARGAIGLTEGLAWPAGAVRLRIVDADGREVHARSKEETRITTGARTTKDSSSQQARAPPCFGYYHDTDLILGRPAGVPSCLNGPVIRPKSSNDQCDSPPRTRNPKNGKTRSLQPRGLC